jgi:hypothetical protein
MKRKPPLLLIVLSIAVTLALIAACQPAGGQPTEPAESLFPTMTPGRVLHGLLDPPGAQDAGQFISNPATVAAMASQPTATPDTGSCPVSSQTATLPAELPGSGHDIHQEIVRFLSEGGSISRLENTLRDSWEILGEDGFIRHDIDLTLSGTPEIIAGYSHPEEGGRLFIAGCLDGRYALHYEVTSDEPAPPDLLLLGDMNRDGYTNVLFTTRTCDDILCSYQTRLIGWRPDAGRFVSLLATPIIGDTQPQARDIDDDGVTEIILRLESSGTSATGPLRTGVYIYDWDGSAYVLSIVQLDPPRYRVQIIHEADRKFARGNYAEAAELFQVAVDDDSLRAWYNDESPLLRTYALYRLLLARSSMEGADLFPTYERIIASITEGETYPVYIDLGHIFWEAYQSTADTSQACRQVQQVIAERPEALEHLNRYGRRSPTYSAGFLCPF